MKKLPRLVIVSGPSGSGKSSIARDIAAELQIAILAKDDLKEGLFDSLGNPDDADVQARLDVAAYVLIERLGTRILEGGVGLVVEGNFTRGHHEAQLGPLVARSRASVIHCHVSPKAMAERLKKRLNGQKKRHPGHVHPDRKLLAKPAKLVESREDLEPPNLDVPIKQIDTTTNHNPSVAKLVSWVREVTKTNGA